MGMGSGVGWFHYLIYGEWYAMLRSGRKDCHGDVNVICIYNVYCGTLLVSLPLYLISKCVDEETIGYSSIISSEILSVTTHHVNFSKNDQTQ